MGILSEMKIEPWSYNRFVKQKNIITSNTWGKDEELHRFGTKMNEMNWHEKSKRFFSPFKQFELYYNWMEDVNDRRTRRIIGAHKFQFYRDISDEEYEKIIKDEANSIVKTTVYKGLIFDLDKIPKDDPNLFRALFSSDDEEIENYEFWIENGSEEEKEFARKYGEIVEIERYSVQQENMAHRFYTFYRAKKYVNKDFKKIDRDSYHCTSMTYQIPSKKDFKRDSERVTEFCLQFAEVDYYKVKKYKDKTQKEMLELIYQKLDEEGFPRPTEVVFPRGLHLVWKINPIPASRYYEWAILQDKIADILDEFGIDRPTMKNKVQLLRLVGTLHTKTGKRIWGRTYTDDRYLFDELLETYCAAEVEKEKEKRKKNRERYLKQVEKKLQAIQGGKTGKKENTVIYNEYNKENKSDQQVSAIIFTRYVRDLFSLVKLRDGQMEGYREFLCFLIRWFSLVIHKGDTFKAEQEMKKMFWALDINGKYTLEEMRDITSNVHKVYEKFLENWRKGYMYKAVTLQEHFNITKEEQQHMITLIDDEERAKRKRKNNAEVQKNKRTKQGSISNEQLEAMIREEVLKDPKLGAKKIAEIVKGRLGKCSNNKVLSVKREMKQEGLI